MKRTVYRLILLCWFSVMLGGCDALITPTPPMATVSTVDLERFMGDWYVMANIPSLFDEGAFNAIKRYRLREDGSVEVLLSFREGGVTGIPKHHKARAFIQDDSGAQWRIRPLWPSRFEYLLIYLSDDYTHAVIGRSKRDYVWILSRRPTLAENEYQRILGILDEHGYDTQQVQKIGQSWPER